MSNYVKLVDYAAKDALVTGNPAKLVKGTEIGADFDAVAVAIATKHDVNGALGTPSSGTLTNCTGLPTAGLVDDAVTYAKVQNVSATDKVLGRYSSGAGNIEEISCTAFARSILDDADEATFKATVNLEVGTDVMAFAAAASQAEMETGTEAALRSMSPLRVSQAIAALSAPLTATTVDATTGGTSVTVSGIPTWAKRVTLVFSGISLSSTSDLLVQIGPVGGVETTGYESCEARITGSNLCNVLTSTAGFRSYVAVAARLVTGTFVFSLLDAASNLWVLSGTTYKENGYATIVTGNKSLAGALEKVSITSTGADTIDANGGVRVFYE